MNKSPESFERDLRREQAIEQAAQAPRDLELAADWALKRELAGLESDALPDLLRRRVLAQARAPSGHRPVWWLAAAAALFASLTAVVLVQLPVPSDDASRMAGAERPGALMPSSMLEPADALDLRLALNTIQQTGRRATWLAGRGLSEHLDPEDVDFGIEQLPYADAIRSVFQNSSRDPYPQKEPKP